MGLSFIIIYISVLVLVPIYALAVSSSTTTSSGNNYPISSRRSTLPTIHSDPTPSAHGIKRIANGILHHQTHDRSSSSSSLSTTKLYTQRPIQSEGQDIHMDTPYIERPKLTNTQWNTNIHDIPNPSSTDIVEDHTTTSTISNKKSQRTLGILVLLSVPLSWGTYAPVVRYVYEMNPPIPGIVFSAGYYIVAAISLIGLELWSNAGRQQTANTIFPLDDSDYVDHRRNESISSIHVSVASTIDSVATTTTATINPSPSSDSWMKNPNYYVPILGGMELGTYLFIGNLLQVIGLKTVPADRAAFLVQLTTIFVPLAQGIVAGNLFSIPGRTWIACLVAFLGVLVMGFDGHTPPNILDSLLQSMKTFFSGVGDASTFTTIITKGDESSRTTILQQLSQVFTGGDLLVVSAALAYTMHVLRLSSYVRKTTPLRLAGAKATVESIWSVGLVLVLTSLKWSCSSTTSTMNGGSMILPSFVCDLSKDITSYFATVKSAVGFGLLTADMWVPAICACLWTGLITCAYTIYAQSYGQRRVDATEANLIYSAQPVFSALFAWGLLGEKLGPAGFLGGALIALGLWLVTTSTSTAPSRQSEETIKLIQKDGQN